MKKEFYPASPGIFRRYFILLSLLLLSSFSFGQTVTGTVSEISVNTANVNEAIARQGPDKLSTRIWWDK